MLREMIAGIPGRQINLHAFYMTNGDPCGTIACIAGWAAIYPPFVDDGLRKLGPYVLFRGTSGQFAAAEFFEVDYRVFSQRRRNERGTNKQIALARLDKLLAK
jgi:hypothetical protein